MAEYTELIKALRCANRYKNFTKDCDSQNPNEPCRYCHHWLCEDDRIFEDAAAAIEDLQKDLTTLQKCYEIADTNVDEVLKQLPKRGKWELIDGSEPMRWGCSRCKYMSWETSTYCPRCGAKMEVQE